MRRSDFGKPPIVDYYHKSTEIYRGMQVIDRKLGGTTPLDVIVDAPLPGLSAVEDEWEGDDLAALYEDDPEIEAGITTKSYWFNRVHIGEVLAIHDYLDGLPETGKVLSIGTSARVLEQIDPTLLNDKQVHLTGMLVLYNNMLESLFRSLRIAFIVITPNMLSAAIILGLMGWAGISLDLMTITIATITIGIGVDGTIHYVHRFEYEFRRDHDYWAVIRRCHATIGRAMYYTSVTVMLGFSALALSKFVSTIYFGLLTSLAMLVALVANMTLLPILLAILHAEGPGLSRG